MISDSAGHVAKNWSGLPTGRKGQCIPAQRAFLSSSSIFFPFSPRLWMCYSQVRSTRNPRMTAITFHCTLGGSTIADRSCLSWDQEGLGQLSVTASYHTPSAPSTDPLGHIKKREQKKKSKNKTKTKNVSTTAHSNKRVQGKKIRNKPKGGCSCLQYKTFERPSFFSLILMTFFLKILFSWSTIGSIKNLYKKTEKSGSNTRIFLKKTHNYKKGATLKNFGFVKSSPKSNVFQWVQVAT